MSFTFLLRNEHNMASPSNYNCFSEELQSFMKAVDAILHQSVAHEGFRIQDYGFVLRLVISLQNASTFCGVF